MNTLITKYAYESNVEHFLGVLSTCIYPDSIDSYPITEDRLHAGAPHADLMSYAYAKRAHAVQLDAYKSSHDLDYNYLVPSNLYGPAPCGHQERAHFVNDLILKVLTAKKCGNTSIELFGDGTPLRQFMLASDFALFIKNYIDNQVNESLNVAPDYNFSVDEMAKMVLEIAAVPEMEIVYNSSKPNGQHRKDVSSDKLKMLFPDFQFTSFREGLKHTLGHYEKIV
jgi:GDP-L-fucose synthase